MKQTLALLTGMIVLGSVVAQGHAQAQTTIWNGVLNYWPFDEGVGVIAHDTTGRNNGTLTNFQFDNTDGWRKGRIGSSCLQFDGQNDFVDLGNKFLLPDSASISAWVNVQGFISGPRFYILSSIGSNFGTSTYVQDDGSVWITDRDPSGHIDSLHTQPGLVLPGQKWHQITFVRGGWCEAIYVDGIKRASGPLSIQTYVNPAARGAIGFGETGGIGLSPTGGVSGSPIMIGYADGKIDDLRVYNRLLLDANAVVGLSAGGEITQLYQAGLVPGDANGDGIADVLDLGILAANWQNTGMDTASGDLNGDGVVDVLDLGILASNWQGTAGSFADAAAQVGLMVPEPATLALLALGGLAMARRRRKQPCSQT